MIKDSKASYIEKALISGHYIFSEKKFFEISEKLRGILKKNNQNLDKILKKEIKNSILRYLYNFNLIN
jgi:hypothetical protein